MLSVFLKTVITIMYMSVKTCFKWFGFVHKIKLSCLYGMFAEWWLYHLYTVFLLGQFSIWKSKHLWSLSELLWNPFLNKWEMKWDVVVAVVGCRWLDRSAVIKGLREKVDRQFAFLLCLPYSCVIVFINISWNITMHQWVMI